ncbi:MAG: hypothetical protein WDK96_02960 [Candidatus Paceibacterota bacterium]|jgi:hypothetical protein
MAIKNYLPSKKVLLLLIVCLVILGLIFYFIIIKNNKENEDKLKSAQNKEAIKDLVSKDSDGDGVLNWEETLWGTDPENKDSNGDGVSDKTEIDQKKKILQPENTSANQDLNETDRFIRDFYSVFTSLDQSGALNNNSLTKISDSISNTALNKELPNVYTEKDILVRADISIESSKTYHTQMKKVLDLFAKRAIIGSELTILNSAIETGDESSLTKIIPIADEYENLSKEVIKVTVPKNLEIIHLAIINNSYKVSETLTNMQNMFSDPIKGISNLILHKKYSSILTGTLNLLTIYFKDKGIVL